MKAYGGYGLLLGALLTVCYGYAAQAAIARDLVRARGEPVAPPAAAADNRIWYGGVLAPITVQGWRPQARVVPRAYHTDG